MQSFTNKKTFFISLVTNLQLILSTWIDIQKLIQQESSPSEAHRDKRQELEVKTNKHALIPRTSIATTINAPENKQKAIILTKDISAIHKRNLVPILRKVTKKLEEVFELKKETSKQVANPSYSPLLGFLQWSGNFITSHANHVLAFLLYSGAYELALSTTNSWKSFPYLRNKQLVYPEDHKWSPNDSPLADYLDLLNGMNDFRTQIKNTDPHSLKPELFSDFLKIIPELSSNDKKVLAATIHSEKFSFAIRIEIISNIKGPRKKLLKFLQDSDKSVSRSLHWVYRFLSEASKITYLSYQDKALILKIIEPARHRWHKFNQDPLIQLLGQLRTHIQELQAAIDNPPEAGLAFPPTLDSKAQVELPDQDWAVLPSRADSSQQQVAVVEPLDLIQLPPAIQTIAQGHQAVSFNGIILLIHPEQELREVTASLSNRATSVLRTGRGRTTRLVLGLGGEVDNEPEPSSEDEEVNPEEERLLLANLATRDHKSFLDTRSSAEYAQLTDISEEHELKRPRLDKRPLSAGQPTRGSIRQSATISIASQLDQQSTALHRSRLERERKKKTPHPLSQLIGILGGFITGLLFGTFIDMALNVTRLHRSLSSELQRIYREEGLFAAFVHILASISYFILALLRSLIFMPLFQAIEGLYLGATLGISALNPLTQYHARWQSLRDRSMTASRLYYHNPRLEHALLGSFFIFSLITFGLFCSGLLPLSLLPLSFLASFTVLQSAAILASAVFMTGILLTLLLYALSSPEPSAKGRHKPLPTIRSSFSPAINSSRLKENIPITPLSPLPPPIPSHKMYPRILRAKM